jgi:hypothetical protein
MYTVFENSDLIPIITQMKRSEQPWRARQNNYLEKI